MTAPASAGFVTRTAAELDRLKADDAAYTAREDAELAARTADPYIVRNRRLIRARTIFQAANHVNQEAAK